MDDVNKSVNSLRTDVNGTQNLRGALEDVKNIAKGGMAQIFRARQPSLDRYIVVKKLKDELAGNPEMVERFRREARALASVLHQNIAHVYDFVEGVRESYILMEYIEGLDLSAILQKMGHLPPSIAAAILLGVARGVSYIHAHNLVHRDIKPSNIRLTTRGFVKLMDFGIVMDIDNTALTRPGLMVGSPSYLSPEQVLGDVITPKADIFLLGIVLYEMVTGTRPFKEEGNATVFTRIREGKYVPARQMQSSIPTALDAIIRKCLKKDPAKRYGDVKALILDLEHFLGAARSSRTEDLLLAYLDEEALLAPAVQYHSIEDKKAWRSQLFWPLVASAALTLGGIFGMGYYFGRRAATEVTVSPTSAFPRPTTLKSVSR